MLEWRKVLSFWVQSTLLTGSWISGFTSFWFLQWTDGLFPAVNIWSGSCREHLVWFLQWTAGGWQQTAANRKKTLPVTPSGGLRVQCCSEALLGQFYSAFWAVASPCGWLSLKLQRTISSKLYWPNITSREPQPFTLQQNLNFSARRRGMLSSSGALSQPYRWWLLLIFATSIFFRVFTFNNQCFVTPICFYS